MRKQEHFGFWRYCFLYGWLLVGWLFVCLPCCPLPLLNKFTLNLCRIVVVFVWLLFSCVPYYCYSLPFTSPFFFPDHSSWMVSCLLCCMVTVFAWLLVPGRSFLLFSTAPSQAGFFSFPALRLGHPGRVASLEFTEISWGFGLRFGLVGSAGWVNQSMGGASKEWDFEGERILPMSVYFA